MAMSHRCGSVTWVNESDMTSAHRQDSHTGHDLTRSVAFKFALDPTSEQCDQLRIFAGAARLTFNHHLARVKDNLTERANEKESGATASDVTPSLSWSKVSFINEVNAWKNGQAPDSPTNDDGTRGLSWRHQISTDVFECASVDAAQALKNWSESKRGVRQGKSTGFPRFKAKHRTTPSFRLRNRSQPGETQSVRFTDPKNLRLPKIGEVRIHGCSRKVRRMIENGRFHIFSATVSYRSGRWWVSINGVAAQFHHERRSTTNRHAAPVGVDLGLTSLAVAASANGQHLKSFEGVKILRSSLDQLRAANKALARTEPGSEGHARAKVRLNRLHANIANRRRFVTHQVSAELVRMATTLVREDLNMAGMRKNRSLALSVSDAAMGIPIRQLDYRVLWYGTHEIVADRWFASSKTCSSCGQVKEALSLSQRTFACPCGYVASRDVNAAVNLAR